MPFPSFFKKGTSSNFTAKRNRSEKPTPPEHERPTEEPKDKAKQKKEEVIEQETEDKQVEKDAGRDPKADKPEGSRDKAPEKKVKDNEARTQTRTVMKSGDENIYSLFWNNMLSYNLQPKTYSKISSFIPSTLALEEILMAAGPIVGRAKYIQKHEATYNEYAVVTYNYILFYIQILRAKQACSNLDGIESNLMTRFTKSHPEETLGVAEPLFPFFNSIVATELEDRKYDWICPDYRIGDQTIGTQTIEAFEVNHARHHILPQIPHMLAILSTFGAMTEAEATARLSAANVFTPHALGAATRLFDRAANDAIDFTTANTAVDDASATLMAAGIRYPFRFFNENWNEARRRMSETDFYGPRGVNFRLQQGVTATEPVDMNPQVVDFRGIDAFLNMPKTKGMRWFTYLKEQNDIFCKMWKNQYNLSDVNVTGGLESTVIVNLRTPTAIAAGRHTYANNHLGLTHTTEQRWYQYRFRDMTGHAFTSRTGVNRKEELQGITFAINSNLPIATVNPAQFRTGKYFEHGVSTNEGTLAQVIGSPTSDLPGPIDMFSGWSSNVIQKAFNADPVH